MRWLPDRVYDRGDRARRRLLPYGRIHPAKMGLGLARDLVLRYTHPGQVLLDPFAGVGTLLLATVLAEPRDVILVELEARFARWANQNYEHLRQHSLPGTAQGRAVIIQGDSRHLPLRSVDVAVSSPPYADVVERDHRTDPYEQSHPERAGYGHLDSYSANRRNLGNLPPGDVSAAISSPPYADVAQRHRSTEPASQRPEYARYGKADPSRQVDGYSDDARNLGNMRAGDVAAAVSSPPYARTLYQMRDEQKKEHQLVARIKAGIVPDKGQRYGWGSSFMGYGQSTTNIGNLPEEDGEAETYWSACAAVYRECLRVVKPGGLLVLVTGDYVRDGKLIPLSDDTVKLAEAMGWTPVERWLARKAALPFWRILAHRRELPDVAEEHVLAFSKGAPAWGFQELPPTTRAPARLPDADALIEAAQQLALFEPPRP